MSNLVRGGQITLHSIRMFTQLIEPLTKWGAVVWVFITISLISIKLPATEYYYGTAYLKAQFYSVIKAQEEPVIMGNKKLKAKYILRSSIAKYYANKAWHTCRDSALISLATIVMGWVGVIIYFCRKGFEVKQSNFVRGREMTTLEELKALIQKQNKQRKYKGYSLVGVPYPPSGETQHTMIAGSTGSGKTILISEIIEQIKLRGDKAVIYDFTGTFTERFYNPKKDIILNPFDSRSRGWSILEEVEHELEFDTIAQALVGNDEKKHGEFWSIGAKTIMSELMKKAYREKRFSIKDLISELFSINVSDLHELVKGTPAHKLTSPENKETTLGLLATLSTYIRSLQYVKEEENNFSISKWISDESSEGCLFLTSVSTIHSSLAPLISMMVNIAVTSLMNTKKNTGKKVWFIFDELGSLNYLPSLEQGLTITRNYGGCFLVGIQSISQLYEKYGHNVTETLSANCKNKVILNAADAKTARWCADTIGNQEVEIVNEGLSYGVDKRRDGVNIAKNYREKNLVLPAEILSLPDLEGYLIMTGGYPIAKIKYDYKNWPALQESIFKGYYKQSNIDDKELTEVEGLKEKAVIVSKEFLNEEIEPENK